ncbi:hypothetical protein DM872_25825 [Pseudomonas taiwanensis]|nr:hypothetical protein [Pseudomonas taiwanensis]
MEEISYESETARIVAEAGAHRCLMEPVYALASYGKTRRKRLRKRSLRAVNEHFEAVFNAVFQTRSSV